MSDLEPAAAASQPEGVPPDASASAPPGDGAGPQPTPPPWGAWATIGWTLLATALFLMVSIAVAIVVIIGMTVAGVVDAHALQDADAGRFAWIDMAAYLLAGPAAVALLLGVIKLRGWSFRRYMALRSCSALALGASLACGALYLGGEILLNHVLDRPIPEFVVDILAVRPAWPLVVLAVVVAAPLVEELVFRGFMYRGLAASRVGAVGAIVITSLLWALIHVQYDWLDVTLIFGLGILLGITRHRTGSLWPAIGVHFLFNLVSMVLMMIYIALGLVSV